MDRRIPKSLIMETTVLVQPVEVFLILLRPEEPQIADFKIAEELTVVIFKACFWVEQPIKVGLRMYELGIGGDKVSGL